MNIRAIRFRWLAVAATVSLAVGAIAFSPPTTTYAGEDLDLLEQQAIQAAVARVAPSVLRVETVGGLQRVGKVLFGTGPTTALVVSADGYLVSSSFNFANQPSSILVTLPDGSRKAAQLVATDHNRKIALLKVDIDKPLAVPQTSPRDQLRIGQWAIAVGRSFVAEKPNVAVGVLSAVDRIWGKAVQTDAAVSPSNYGGPLIDIHGRVIGVLVPQSPEAAGDVAGYEWYDSGIGFAVNIDDLLKVLPRLKEGKDLHPGLVGISLEGENMAISEPVIANCRPGSPAQKGGIKKDDRIVAIDGQPILTAADVKKRISQAYAGDTLRMVVKRGDQQIPCDVQLVDKLVPFQHGMFGILPRRTPGGPEGVEVRYVYPESPAAKAGIKPGDILLKLGEEAVADRYDLIAKIGAMQPGDTARFAIRHGEKAREVSAVLVPLPEALPPAELPAARASVPAAEGELPEVGSVALKIPEMANEAMAYVPEDYNPAVTHGVVVWLHGPGGYVWPDLLAQWKSLCDANDLILLAPKSADPEKWTPNEMVFAQKVLEQLVADYQVDPTRIVAHGYEKGATIATLLAYRNRDLVRALALVDAPLAGPPPENEPLERLAVYLTKATEAANAPLIERSIKACQERKIPVTVKPQYGEPRPLDAKERAELVRWIDILDRI